MFPYYINFSGFFSDRRKQKLDKDPVEVSFIFILRQFFILCDFKKIEYCLWNYFKHLGIFAS